MKGGLGKESVLVVDAFTSKAEPRIWNFNNIRSLENEELEFYIKNELLIEIQTPLWCKAQLFKQKSNSCKLVITTDIRLRTPLYSHYTGVLTTHRFLFTSFSVIVSLKF